METPSSNRGLVWSQEKVVHSHTINKTQLEPWQGNTTTHGARFTHTHAQRAHHTPGSRVTY